VGRKAVTRASRSAGIRVAAVLLVLCGTDLSTLKAAAVDRPIRIGVLTEAWGPNPQTLGLRDGLRELGYRDDLDFEIGVRFTRGNVSELPTAARELVAQGVDILFTGGGMAIKAAQAATARVPIVFAGGVDDPVAAGLVESIAHPGGNITGIVALSSELAGKRLEVFRDLVPSLKRVLVAYATDSPSGVVEGQAYRDAARRLGITLVERPLRDQAEARTTFVRLRKGELNGLLVSHSLSLNVPGYAIEASARLGIPAMFPASFFVEQGGLISYGSDYYATGRQAARLVDKIVKGAKPGDLPVETNPRIELTLNMKTARRIGLPISAEMLGRMDRVFE